MTTYGWMAGREFSLRKTASLKVLFWNSWKVGRIKSMRNLLTEAYLENIC